MCVSFVIGVILLLCRMKWMVWRITRKVEMVLRARSAMTARSVA
jgi:hypothetical protein